MPDNLDTQVRSKSPQPGTTSQSNVSARDLVKKRGTIKQRLTLFIKYVNSLKEAQLTERQLTELKLRQKSNVSLLQEFNSIQSMIEESTPDGEFLLQLEAREEFENFYFDVMTNAEYLLKPISVVKTSDGPKCSDSSSLLKLPTITLPSFDGSYDNWLEFKNIYVSMIHNSNQLDNIQKLYYLRAALTGNAADVIKSLQFSSENYEIAWDLLEKRFNNDKLLVHNHVKALFCLHTLSKESSSLIRKLIDTVLKNLRSLKSLGEPTDSWDTLIVYIIVSKLDSATEKEWEQFKMTMNNSNKTLNLNDLIQFLRDKADLLEMVKANSNNSTISNYKVTQEYSKKPQQKVHSFVAAQGGKPNKRIPRACHMCSANHSLYTCNAFLELSPKDKLDFVDSKNLCKNCLRLGHASKDFYFGPCRQCSKKHNTLLHSECGRNSALVPAVALEPQTSSDSSIDTTTGIHVISQPQVDRPASTSLVTTHALEPVLLSTALIEILDRDNKYHKAKALLDSGSQHCIITNSFCNKLNILPIQSTYRIAGVGNSIAQSTHSCKIQLKSLNGDYSTRLTCMVLPRITATLPAVGIDMSLINIPGDIKLADPTFCTPSEIDLLIGADCFWELLLEGRIRLPTGPYLQNTQLGWIVSGPIFTDNRNLRTNQVQCNFVQTLLDEQLKKFWELEEIPQKEQYFTPDELACEKLFTETTKRNNDGRFLVRMPLKESPDVLGDSYNIAKTLFLSLERKFERNPQYKQMYSGFMQEYLALGHMTRIEHYMSPYYFFPHHGILREHSLTTKFRIVYNASQKTSSDKSLNDIQMPGPALQNDLFSILLRFRKFKYVACADVEKMFRQILIQEDQRCLQLILWRENPSDPLCVYQLNTVTYGTASAPFLSMRCVRQLGLECEDKEVSEHILNNFYVDDLVTGHDDKTKLSSICEKIADVCMSGCLPLRKWIFNSPDIAPCVAADLNSKHLSLGENCSSKTLGLGWSNNTDELHFTSSITQGERHTTKRLILSVVSQIYDPLGLLSPVIIIAKVLLQKLWLSKVGWDDSLPEDVVLSWEKFVESLRNLPNIRIPRHAIGNDRKQIGIHIFTDASLTAYGACAYIRTVDGNDYVTTHLLCSKSRVAPLKPVSIPRLELLGVLIGARLLNKILKSLQVNFDHIVIWTDSTIVLGWLKTSPQLLKTFVQNRVVEINEVAGNAMFLHVSTKNNPADILSRGMGLDELANCDLWWKGPLFLRDYDLTYSSNLNIDQSNLPELKTKVPTTMTFVSQPADNNESGLIKFERFSSFKRMQRACAYVLRFIHNARTKCKQDRFTGALSVNELNESLNLLTKIVQTQSFPDEHKCLINNLPLKRSRNLSSLNLFCDKNHIIRVGGRLLNSHDFAYDKKHPMLLCSKHHFTRLLFRFEHFNLLHAGPQALLAHIRDAWWPLGGRNLAKKTVRTCIICIRMKGKTLQPIMGNLPNERLQAGYPFLRCGVDYAGPMYILNRKGRGAKLEKCYLCVFVCFTTRAVHLELVTSLTSESYIMALKRFISRRGKPLQVFSDNGRSFVGAAKEFADFLHSGSQSLIDYASDNKIEFKFIPPYAPHFGGLWESGVRSCKHHITRVVGNANLTYEEFSTVLAQIEAVLNSRPMCPMSADPNDLAPLTPAHFLLGRPLTAPACEDCTTTATHALSRYKRVEQMRQHFWKRWSTEYITELQRRTKWKENKDDIVPDTLVIIKDDHLPPLKWHLGRILTVFPGRDHTSRVAKIRTATGVTLRAFSKICPLPITTSGAAHSRADD